MAEHVYSLIISYNTAGQFAQNVLHWKFEDGGFTTTKAAAEALQAAFDAARRTTLRACLPTDVSLVSYRGSRVDGGGGFEAFSPITGSVAGTRAGTQSASALNPVIVTAPATNIPARGKIFLPGVSETDIADGKFTEAFKGAMLTNLSTLLDPVTLSGGGNPSAIYGWIRGPGVTFIPGVTTWLSMNLGTQRRRMRPV